MIYVCDIIQWPILGRGPPPPPSLIFRPNRDPKGRKNILETPDHHAYLRIWMTPPPPPLSQGVIRCRIRDNTADVQQQNFIQTRTCLPSLFPIMQYVEIPPSNTFPSTASRKMSILRSVIAISLRCFN